MVFYTVYRRKTENNKKLLYFYANLFILYMVKTIEKINGKEYGKFNCQGTAGRYTGI